MDKIFLSVRECCQLYGLGRTKIYALLASGELTKAKIGRRSFITVESAQALADRSILRERDNVTA